MKVAHVDNRQPVDTTSVSTSSKNAAMPAADDRSPFHADDASDGLLGATRSETVVRQSRIGKGQLLKNLAMWSRHLAVLVRSGTPLAQALAALERQTTSERWREVLTDLRRNVEEGLPLSGAMRRYPAYFDEARRGLTAAGESSGQLGTMLTRVADITRQELKIRRTMTSALVYPMILIFVGCVITVVMLTLVLPRFAALFTSLNMSLPPTTEALMYASNILRSYWWMLILGAVVAGITATRCLHSKAGRRWRDSVMVRIPYFGRVTVSIFTARIARLLGTLLQSHVPLLEAIELTRESIGNVHYIELMTSAEDAATRGERVSGVFLKSPLITPSVAESMRHGEENGQIGVIMTDMADFLDEENEVVVRTAMSVLEPLILIGLGVIVAFIALSLFIPLFDIAAMTGGQ